MLNIVKPLLMLMLCLMIGCQKSPSFKVVVAKFQHETCTFCPGDEIVAEDWQKILKGDEVFESGNYVEGFTVQARDYGDMDLIGLTSPSNVFGGSSRSWNTEETFNYFLDQMIYELKESMPVDGVYLALHGAMAVRGVPRPEAEIARRFREVVGSEIPIAGTFDLHGNEDAEFLKWADFAFVTKRFPHYDSNLQGARAARAIHRVMTGTYTPTNATRKPGIITATVLQWTGQSPSMDIMERARRWEAKTPDVFVSIFYGYPWSDVPDVGATVHVMTNGDQKLANQIADDMNDYIWRVRKDFALGQYPGPQEAADMVSKAIKEGRLPVAVGDYSDRPGDATHIFKAFQNKGIQKILHGAISSPSTLDTLISSGAKVGDPFDMKIGGYTPSGGTPVRVKGKLEYLGPWAGYDAAAIVSYGQGNAVFITPAYTQIMYPEDFRIGPIDPADFDVFVVNSRAHFRRGFDETGFAPTILIVEAPEPFVGTTHLDALDYQNVDLSKQYPYGKPYGR